MLQIKGLPGGAQKSAVGTTAVTMDLSAFVGREVLIWSKDQDLLFSFSATSGVQVLVGSGDQAASLTALVADDAPKGIAKRRYVSANAPYLVVAAAASTALVKVKPVSEKGVE